MGKIKSYSFKIAVLPIAGLSFVAGSLNKALAQGTLQDAAKTLAEGSPIGSTDQIFNILNKIVTYTYRIFFIAAIFFILLAAYNFLFARDDAAKIKTARSQIFWAVIAIVVALLSVGASQIILSFIPSR